MRQRPSFSAFITSAVLTATVVSTPASTHAQTVAKVDPSIQFQTFEGWGTSLAWWANVVGGMPEPARTDYMDKAFDPIKGLGLNIVRYNIGGGENPQYLLPNKQFLQHRAKVPGFQPSPGVWDWNADVNQRWVLKEAIKRGANHLEAFSNSPPWWMTQSGSVTGNHGGKDNLKPEYDVTFAEYLAEVTKHFRDQWGITFETLDPLNEPNATWWPFGKWQEGCHVDPPHQNTLLKATAAALAKRGLSTRVSASDESILDDAARTFTFYDAQALAGMSRINTHSYGGNARTQVGTLALGANKNLWLSEYGDADDSGLQTSRRIVQDIKYLHPSAWAYWQVVDSSGGWGFLRNPLDNESKAEYMLNKKYYVMGQYSRFIRPGYRFIAIDEANSLAAYDARSKTLVIVSTNVGEAENPVSYDLRSFSQVGATATAYRTSATEEWAKLAPLALTNRTLKASLAPKSVTTYVLTGVSYTGARDFDPNAFYTLTNRTSGRRLRTGKPIPKGVQSVTQGAVSDDPAQQWRIIGLGSGLYQLANRVTGLVLEVGGGSKAAGASVNVYANKYDAVGASNQQWRIAQQKRRGVWTLVNANSGLALDIPAGNPADAPLLQNTRLDSTSAEWVIAPVSTIPRSQRR